MTGEELTTRRDSVWQATRLKNRLASSLWAFLLETSNSPLSTKRGLATYELAGEVGLLEMRELSFLTPG